MTDIPIKNIGNNVPAAGTEHSGAAQGEAKKNFNAIIEDALSKVSTVQNDVDRAVSELAAGGDVTSAILAVEKADMTFQVMVEIRNKLLSTYEEIMRMQV